MTSSGLCKSGRGRSLGAGDQAPELEFVGPSGRPLRSSEMLAQGPLLLTFYRGRVVPLLPGRPA